MIVEPATGKSGFKTFQKVSHAVYKGNPFFRGTEASIEKMLILGPTHFHAHATVLPCVVSDRKDYVARFALIYDQYLPDYVQVAFFEAMPGLKDVLQIIRNTIKSHFPSVKKMVVGLNGHLNYGAGFLLNHFNEPPLFGLPYSQPYYPAYFEELLERKMVSFRFPMEEYAAWANAYQAKRSMPGLTVRFMNKKDIRKESAIYTLLNNKAFIHHPYWAERADAEDLELFSPFRFFLENENLVIAEYEGKPVGFYLWYPDFNQLIHSQRDFNAYDVLHYKLNNPIDTIRFTEIGIIPEFHRSPVALAMIEKALPAILKGGYRFCEGGFIFEENKNSIAFVSRILTRSMGQKPEPYREYAVYEGTL